MCVGVSGGRLKSADGRGGGANVGVPQGRVDKDSAGNWRGEFFFSLETW